METVQQVTVLVISLLMLVEPASLAMSQPWEPVACLVQLPVSLDVCLEEFLAAGRGDSAEWFAFIAQIQDQLFYDQVDQVFRIYPRRKVPREEPFAYQLPPGIPENSERGLILRESRKSREIPYLSSGGWINVATLRPFLDGHSDVTKRVLAQQFKFHYTAQAIVADASQDPDFYAWSTDAAHAQTPAGKDGRVATGDLTDGSQATEAFVGWVSAQLLKAKKACDEGTTQYSLYWLGYALHAVQDLAAHNGRTSYEHAWNSYCSNAECDSGKPAAPKDGDPDEDPTNIDLARRYTSTALEAARRVVGDKCWREMKRYDGPGVTVGEKVTVLGLTWDFLPGAIREYRAGAVVYARRVEDRGYRVRWLLGADRRVTPFIERIAARVVG